MKPRKRDVNERFDEKVDRGDGTGCWTWTGARQPTGYGRFKIRSYVAVAAHRFAFQRANGPIPDGKWICHRCDNPSCVRPDHLFAETPAANVHDMLRKARHKNAAAWTAGTGRRRERTGRSATSTHCRRGHEWTEENTRLWRGEKRCRACDRERWSRRQEIKIGG